MEMTAQRIGGVGQLIPGGGLLGGCPLLAAEALPQLHHVVHDDLHRGDAGQLIRQGIHRVGHFVHEELTGGNIREGKARPVRGKADRQQEVVRPLVQHIALDNRAGGDDAGDAALHQALGQGGILHLLANGDLIAAADELFDIVVHSMMRHAAHGSALLQAAVAPGKGQFQLPGGRLRIIEEHLIKIAQAEEEQTVLVFSLHLKVLLHHRCQASHCIPCRFVSLKG